MHKTGCWRIALVTAADAESRRAWSGTLFFILQALRRYCGEVTPLGPVRLGLTAGKLCNQLSRWLVGKTYDYLIAPAAARQYACIFRQRLAQGNYDLVFAPDAPAEIALLDTALPLVYLNDATFQVLDGYHPEFQRLLGVSRRDAAAIDRAAISRADLCLFSSPWAARSAVADAGADPAKVHVVPFGANIEQAPAREQAVDRTLATPLRLLFLAKRWAEKGGEIALDTLRALERLGVAARLTVVGGIPPAGVAHPRLHVRGYLDKRDAAQRRELEALFTHFDLLLLPTRADCTPIVFCEANAFGLPVISTDTGGVSGVITHGENGLLLPYAAGGDAYARVIADLLSDTAGYRRLVEGARRAYDERLNWDAWGRSVRELMEKLMQGRES